MWTVAFAIQACKSGKLCPGISGKVQMWNIIRDNVKYIKLFIDPDEVHDVIWGIEEECGIIGGLEAGDATNRKIYFSIYGTAGLSWCDNKIDEDDNNDNIEDATKEETSDEGKGWR